VRSTLLRLYASVFARKRFRMWNTLLFELGLRGLGILNYQDRRISGEVAFLNHYLQGIDNPVVLDVGANAGSYSREVVAINPSASVFAFEPHPRTFERLVVNVGTCRNIHPVHRAIGDVSGRHKLYDRSSGCGTTHASFFHDVIEGIHNVQASECEVDVITLDEFIEEQQLTRVDLLKIDTEGYELNVLKGGGKAIRSGIFKVIQFEFNEMNVVSRAFFKDFLEMLPQYRFHRMLPGELQPINRYSPRRCELFAFQNIVAILCEERGES
jgi:FkbM family methyltransferase